MPSIKLHLLITMIVLSTAVCDDQKLKTVKNETRTSLRSKTLLLMDALSHVETNLLHMNTFTNIKKYLQTTPTNVKETPISLTNDNSACIDNLDDIIDSILRKQYWALKILDSCGKIPTGLLNGNIINMGDYDQCVSTSSGMSGSAAFQGQYCLISLVIEVPPEIIFDFTGSSAEDMFGSNIVLKTAICVPSTCKPKAIELAFNNLLDRLNPWLNESSIPVALRITIPDSDCHIRNSVPFNTIDWIALGLILLFTSFIVLSTIFDLWLRSYRGPCYSTLNKGPRAVLAFSAYSNAQRLFSTKTQPETISCINGLRFLSITWVCLGHRVKYMAQLPATNLTSLLQFIKNWPTMAIVNATLAVDTFFVISGLLNAYIFLGYVNKSTSLSSIWPSYLIKRYIRLTPAFAAMVAFTGTLLYKFGDGPLWDQLAGQESEACVEHWWVNLLYFNNYYHTEKLCMMQSWYLSVDTQLYALSILILHLLKNNRFIGILLLSILMIASMVIPFVVSYLDKIRAPIPLTRDGERVNREMAIGYFPTHMRASSYLVGLAAGYILHRVKTGQWSERMVFVLTLRRAFIWVAAVSMMMSSLFLCYWMFQPEVPYLWFYSSFYIAVHRFMWAIGIAWIIIDSTFNKDGVVNRFLSCQFFMPLGRLTYCIYLTHISVIIFKLGTARQPAYISPYDQFHETIGDIVISIAFATVLSLLFESPIMVLEKTLFHDSGKSNHDHQNESNDERKNKHESHSSSQDHASDIDIESNISGKGKNSDSTLKFRPGKILNDKVKKASEKTDHDATSHVDTWPIDTNKHRHRAEISVIPNIEERADFFTNDLNSAEKSCSVDYRKKYPKSPFLSGRRQESEISYAANPYTKIDYERISMQSTSEVALYPWKKLAACSYVENNNACSPASLVHHRFGNRLQREAQEDNQEMPNTDRISNSVLSTSYGVNNPIYHYATSNFDET